MRRRSRKASRGLVGRPAIRSIPDKREAVECAVDEGLREFVRRLPCAVCLAHTIGSQACHVGARRRHGDWVYSHERESLDGNLWPGCADHHGEEHQHGVMTFQESHRLSRANVARVIGEVPPRPRA